MPAATEQFPWHDFFGVDRFGVAELQAGFEGFGEERAECGGIDFGFFPDLDRDFLPCSFQVAYSDAWFAAVDRNFLHVIQRWQSECGIEFFGGEGVFANAEAENEEPFAAGASVEEPAESFCGADFDGGAVVPVGGSHSGGPGELFDEPDECISVPAAGLSGAGEAVFGVPAYAVDFPWEFGGAGQFGDINVADFFGREAAGVKDRYFASLRVFEDGREEFSGPRAWPWSEVFGVFGGCFGFGFAGWGFGFGSGFGGVFDNVFGGPLDDDAAAAGTCFGSEVDDPVCGFDDIEVMFDDDDGIALFDEAGEDAEEFGDVVEVQSGGGFVEEVECLSAAGLAEFSGEFDALGFTAAECGCGLSEGEVSKSDGIECGEWFADAWDVGEEFECAADGHFEHVGDAAAVEADAESFCVEAFASAGWAFDPDIREEVHFDFLLSHTFAVFAASAGAVETEAALLEPANAGIGKSGEQVANGFEDAGVGSGVGGGSGADGVLVDGDDATEEFAAAEIAVWPGGRWVHDFEFAGDGRCECVHQQAAFSGAADTGDTGEGLEGDAEVDLLEVVLRGAEEFECGGGCGCGGSSGAVVVGVIAGEDRPSVIVPAGAADASVYGKWDVAFAAEVGAGERAGVLANFVGAALCGE